MSRGPDVATLLERAVLESARAAGCPLVLRASEMTRWASVTFTGAKHLLNLEGQASPALDAWLLSLPETEFTLRDHLVADMVLLAVKREGVVGMMVEVLTLEDR